MKGIDIFNELNKRIEAFNIAESKMFEAYRNGSLQDAETWNEMLNQARKELHESFSREYDLKSQEK